MLKNENKMLRLVEVRKFSILLLSSMRCRISPVSLVSKKATGRDINF